MKQVSDFTQVQTDPAQPLRVLVLGINYAPEIISTGLYSTGLAEALAARGHEVDVVTAHPYYPEWKRAPGFAPFAWKRTGGEPGEPRVLHCTHYIPAHPTGARRILHHASFAMSALMPTLIGSLRHRPDLVFAVAPALLSAPVALMASRMTGAKSWLHVQDLEVDAAFATGLLADEGLVARAARRFERSCLRRFDRVSTISAAMRQRIIDKGVPESRLFELRNWADLSAVTPDVNGDALRAELGITTPHVALYSGNLANKQGLEILPDLARRLATRNDFTLLICGAGSGLDPLREASAGLPSIRFAPLQPRERLGELLALADVHLLPQIDSAADLVLPSKLTNILASGRPVVATARPGTALAAEMDGAGIVTPPGDGAAFAAAVSLLLEDPALRQKLGVAARARAEDRLDKARIIDRFEAEAAALCAVPAGRNFAA